MEDLVGGDPEFPRKLLDKKYFVRMDHDTGEPQLLRMEPMISDDGELLAETVLVTIDNGQPTVMERSAAESYLVSQKWEPLERFAKYKHRLEH